MRTDTSEIKSFMVHMKSVAVITEELFIFILCNFVVTEGGVCLPFLVDFSHKLEHWLNTETGLPA